MKPSNEQLFGKLFRWRTTVEYNGVKFYVRVVSDAVVEDARRYALLEARKMRRDLRDSTSDAYLIELDYIDEMERDELSALVQIAASREIMRTYLNEHPRATLPELPESPTQEQLEEHEAAKEAQDAEYLASMQEYVEEWRANFEKRLEAMDTAALRKLAHRYRIDEVCEALFNREFESYIVASSVFSDDKYSKRMLTLEEYKELPTEVQQLLYNAYNNMNITADEIKNS